jgi:predicted TIM-barrel fold metal-dependent hydrolase
MDSIYRDYEYEAELKERFKAKLPKKVFDAHFHLSKKYASQFPQFHSAFDEWHHYMSDILGENRLSGGLMMCNPSKTALETEGENNEYIFTQTHEGDGYAIALVVTPQCNKEKIKEIIAKNPKITTLKPYFEFSISKNKYESDILDFAPEWMWELAHELKMSILLHLSHYKNLLYDSSNIEQLNKMCLKYPDVRLVLAHCAMGHNPDKLKSGLQYIDNLDNIWFDCSGIAEPAAICHVLDVFGPKKLLYGGDHDFGARPGRIASFGSSFVHLRKEDADKERSSLRYKADPMSHAMEDLLALFVACEEYGLDKQAWEDIFYNNARWLFRIDEKTNDVARDPEGFEKAIRKKAATQITGAKGAELYFGLAPYYDTAKYIKDVPLGFANIRVMNSQKGTLLAGYPATCTYELESLLLELNPWAKNVILTSSGHEAKRIAYKLLNGKRVIDKTGANILNYNKGLWDGAIYGESMSNGTSIGAILLSEDISLSKEFNSTIASPSALAIKAAITTLNILDKTETKNKFEEIIKCVRKIWETVAKEMDLSIKVDKAPQKLGFCFENEANEQVFSNEMKMEGFIANTVFYPSIAHTEQILNRYERALRRVFEKKTLFKQA